MRGDEPCGPGVPSIPIFYEVPGSQDEMGREIGVFSEPDDGGREFRGIIGDEQVFPLAGVDTLGANRCGHNRPARRECFEHFQAGSSAGPERNGDNLGATYVMTDVVDFSGDVD